MKTVRIVSLVCSLFCLFGLIGGALAAEVDCDAQYCFTAGDFSGEEDVRGICITQLPDAHTGTVMLGSRVLREGDILTADQLAQMTFSPLRTTEDTQATVTYLPIYENRVEKSTTMSISIRGKEDKAPVAEDMAVETYKNLPNEGKLKVSDPEGEKMTFTLVRPPKRGEVTIREDGTFTYTPKKNKVGVDSFVYTAADPAGNVSREATVTVQILKPTDARQYTDTAGMDCRFEAEWLKNTGLFTGERINGENCFFPEKTVSRGDFLAMTVKMLNIPAQTNYEEIPENVPQWLKPYVGAAMRSGLMDGLPETDTLDMPITGAEAAVILQNALDLTLQTGGEADQELPVWAADSIAVMSQHGVELSSESPMTRAQAAEVLYQAKLLSFNAPGMAVFHLQ